MRSNNIFKLLGQNDCQPRTLQLTKFLLQCYVFYNATFRQNGKYKTNRQTLTNKIQTTLNNILQ